MPNKTLKIDGQKQADFLLISISISRIALLFPYDSPARNLTSRLPFNDCEFSEKNAGTWYNVDHEN
ncbi:conserved hypothetical protein [delta proteobacterium NaphS2]|nr:conserved hypothetical protein [delta proteobacterium NaphS2]